VAWRALANVSSSNYHFADVAHSQCSQASLEHFGRVVGIHQSEFDETFQEVVGQSLVVGEEDRHLALDTQGEEDRYLALDTEREETFLYHRCSFVVPEMALVVVALAMVVLTQGVDFPCSLT
jgi:hypothetical protein